MKNNRVPAPTSLLWLPRKCKVLGMKHFDAAPAPSPARQILRSQFHNNAKTCLFLDIYVGIRIYKEQPVECKLLGLKVRIIN
jgi:hypothetical protein